MTTPSRPAPRPVGFRLLTGLLAAAVLVSIVHYVDNVANYAQYPEPTSGPPAPSAALIGVSWFVFTAFGTAGFVLFMRHRITTAAACLAIYSVSGLVGLGHYTVPGATDMPWWRQLHVIADIALGIAMLAFAIWAVRGQQSGPTIGEPQAPGRRRAGHCRSGCDPRLTRLATGRARRP